MKQNFAFFVPVYNLIISKNLNEEFKIDNVTFISSSKIPRVRKRLGLSMPLSYYEKRFKIKKPGSLFKASPTYAHLRSCRELDGNLSFELTKIKEAIYILASSGFYRGRRKHRILFGGPEFSIRLVDQHVLINSDTPDSKWTHRLLSPIQPYKLDRQWRSYTRHHFFHYLVPILNGKVDAEAQWKKDLRRAAILAGQSFLSRSVIEAFLYDMIAIETLLNRRGDKFPDSITERVFALFGWLSDEDPAIWKEMITRLYKRRSEFVHAGYSGKLTAADLYDADMILSNLLWNFSKLGKVFKSKDDIVSLAKEIDARRTLGLKSKRRPKGIRFSSRLLKNGDKARV